MTLARFNYYVFLFGLTFGVFLYDFISNVFHFTYIDELLALALLLLYFCKAMLIGYVNKEFLIVIATFLFYLIYSLYIHTNATPAIWMDFFILSKPFVAFYCFYEITPQFTDVQKKFVNRICCIFGVMTFLIACMGLNTIYLFFGHPSRLATATTILAVTYLYCSERRKKDIHIFMIILAIGLLSFRSKHYVLFVSALGLLYYLKNIKLKTILPASLLLLPLMIWAGWAKFNYYFIQGSQAENIFARPALFLGAWDLLHIYFPFGSGFGSYASYASAVYMSPLYSGIPILQLASEIQDGQFLCDSFLPQLAQFGVTGIVLFFLFWFFQIKRGYINFLKTQNIIAMKMILLTTVFFCIESIPDTTFTHNRGMFMMMLFALWIKETGQIPNANSHC